VLGEREKELGGIFVLKNLHFSSEETDGEISEEDRRCHNASIRKVKNSKKRGQKIDKKECKKINFRRRDTTGPVPSEKK